MEHNAQGRRPHFHRGRRGPDRRGPERRTTHATQEHGTREQTDVEQIMREIRARISQTQGIDLTTQQIQELAARRLEAILDPRSVNPTLLDQLRKSAAAPAEKRQPEAPQPPYTFDDNTLYETHRGLLRFFRTLLNPILKLFFNPTPVVRALNTQAQLNVEAAAREAERDRRQAEWNALHYEILQRLVTEISRVSLEMQSLSLRVESLSAKVDFNDRRVRGLESTPSSRAGASRPSEAAGPAVAVRAAEGQPAEAAAGEAAGEGTRRRRRRRRGRRSGTGVEAGAAAGTTGAVGDTDALENEVEEPEGEPEPADVASAPPFVSMESNVEPPESPAEPAPAAPHVAAPAAPVIQAPPQEPASSDVSPDEERRDERDPSSGQDQ